MLIALNTILLLTTLLSHLPSVSTDGHHHDSSDFHHHDSSDFHHHDSSDGHHHESHELSTPNQCGSIYIPPSTFSAPYDDGPDPNASIWGLSEYSHLGNWTMGFRFFNASISPLKNYRIAEIKCSKNLTHVQIDIRKGVPTFIINGSPVPTPSHKIDFRNDRIYSLILTSHSIQNSQA
jgi:hypothetical protein